jgi:hypothetical protein
MSRTWPRTRCSGGWPRRSTSQPDPNESGPASTGPLQIMGRVRIRCGSSANPVRAR